MSIKVNILVDFQENGQDKNEPHIVYGTTDELAAGMFLKKQLENKGYKIQSLTVIDGDWTLQQLYDMANYGDYLDKVNSHIIYLSDEMVSYLERIRSNPVEAKKAKAELEECLERRKRTR